MPHLLTDEQRNARVAIPAVEADPLMTMFRKECSECGGPIKWIAPAALAELDRATFIDMRRANGIDGLLNSDLWVCLRCDNLGLMGAGGSF